MHNVIIQELDARIDKLKRTESRSDITDYELKCIESRIFELESMKRFVAEHTVINTQPRKRLTNHEFWRLVDEF